MKKRDSLHPNKNKKVVVVCLIAYQPLWVIFLNAEVLTHSWEDKEVHTFPKGISLKVNVIVQLELELAYFEAAVLHFNHCVMGTLKLESEQEYV